tara:strand:+ start:204 stop:566 length:363 start_codon:yes stop_codon:yes gene_type:complete
VEGGVARDVEITPSGFKATRENGTSYGAKLRDAVIHYEEKNWPTASTRDHKGGYTGGRIRNGKVSMDTLDVAVQAHSEGGLLDQVKTNTNGSNPVLNPDWVEQLMGLPAGWTDLDYSAME